MEAISIAMGAAAAKFIVRLWSQGTASEIVGDDLVTLFGSNVQGLLARRALQRQLSQMADQIAERLAPFLSVEIRGIEPNELEAAANAAQESLERADAMDLGVLLSIDLHAGQLTKLIRANDPNAISNAGLGEAGSGVYDTLISECASYITSIASQLPGYGSKETQELLSRHSQLAQLALEILDNLPQSSVPKEWGVGSDDQRFENKYRQAVREYAEQLQLFGVVPTEARRAYPLSVAYISMAVDEHHSDAGSTTGLASSRQTGPVGGHEPDKVSDVLRVETLLEDTDKLILTGGAGSGKTTLIQWIALSSVVRVTNAAAPQGWTERVPFVIPLRHFVGKSLPTPQQFVKQIAPNIAEAMPPTWVHRVLAAGRGTVLIDGLDEIPHGEREQARLWVLELVRDFPKNKYLITSRTTAITKAWRDEESFRRAELLPMEGGDIRAFVAHWHEATRQSVAPSKKSEIDVAERSMLAIVRDRSAIRALCTSPLLCALLCALHLQNASSLPNNRMDVYRTALEMLVHKRDSDRHVNVAPVDIDFAERQILLRSFASWLHGNGAADATREDFEAKITKGVKELHRVRGTGPEIASFMLERSGVLREPVSGRVDFVHRTFLEYLAAAAIVDDNSIDMLIRSAHDDHWREVIILAAGHANSQQRDHLLNGLLSLGADKPRRRHRLFLLAVACMETSPQLSTDLRARLEKALQDVLPPANMTEAMAVASAGELAVPLLRSFAGERAGVAAASVRALALIGGDNALQALEAFRSDKRVTVTRQLIRAWSSFDTVQYAANILAYSPLDNGYIAINDPDQISQLSALPRAHQVFVSFPRRFTSVSDLPAFPASVFGVEINGLSDLASPAALPFHRTMKSITLRNSSLRSLDGIEDFNDLRYLSVSGSADLSDVDALASLSGLSFLDLSGTGIVNLRLNGGSTPSWVQMYAARTLESIPEPLKALELNIGFAPSLRDLSGIEASQHLRNLQLDMGTMDSVRLPASIESVSLTSWQRPYSVSGGRSLKRASLHGAITSTTLDWLVGLPSAKSVSLSVRDDEIGGWSPATAVAELCANVATQVIFVSWPYGSKVQIPERSGWRMEMFHTYGQFTRIAA